MWIFLSFAAFAAETGGANILGAGGTDNAAYRDNAAITANPGVLGLRERYDFSGLFRYGPTGDLEWGGGIVDSKTSPSVAFGLGYVGGITDPPIPVDDLPGWKLPDEDLDNTRHDHQITGALAAPLWDRRLSVGVSGDVLIYKREQIGNGTTGNVHVGAGFSPIEALAIGAVVRNLVPLDDTDPLEVGAGVQLFDAQYGLLAADWDWRPGGTSDLGFGGQLNLGSGRARAGFEMLGSTGEQRMSWGIGGEGQGFGLDYAMAIPINDVPNDGVIHMLSLRLAAPDVDSVKP